MAAFGFKPEDYQDSNTILIWPDNWQPFQTFRAMGTQWRTGMNGPTGLDYAALPVVLRLEGVPRKQHQDTFDCIRAMESAALTEIHKKDKA